MGGYWLMLTICRTSWYGWLWVDVDYMQDVVVWVAIG